MQPDTARRPGRRPRTLAAKLCTSMVLLLQAACSGNSGVGSASAAASLPTGVLAHGPFEIVAGVNRVSNGTFPNQGGSPFATREVSAFQVRWRRESVVMPGGGSQRFWRVLRLEGAPRPALLLVTTGFVLATEDAAGQRQLTPIKAECSSLAEVQWLDVADGQPEPSQRFGIEAVADLQAGTQLAGGRWLRLGSRSVMDVATLTVFAVAPWVPTGPGVPDICLLRQGDEVRAFSPGRTQYVLAAAGIDYSRADQARAQAHGLLVVDIAKGTATELRADRNRLRFVEPDDVNVAWVKHHFSWQPDSAGVARLVPRERFTPWPSRARMRQPSPNKWQLEVRRIDATAFIAVLRRRLEREPGVQVADASTQSHPGLDIALSGWTLQATAYGAGSRYADSHWLGASAKYGAPGQSAADCEPALRRLSVLIDAGLATGRHDALLKLA